MTVVKGNLEMPGASDPRAWRTTVSSSPDQLPRSRRHHHRHIRSFASLSLARSLARARSLVVSLYCTTLSRFSCLEAGDHAVQDCIYTFLTSVISHFAPRTRLEFVFHPYQTSNSRTPREKASIPHTYAFNRPRHPCRRSSSNAPPCWRWPASSP